MESEAKFSPDQVADFEPDHASPPDDARKTVFHNSPRSRASPIPQPGPTPCGAIGAEGLVEAAVEADPAKQ